MKRYLFDTSAISLMLEGNVSDGEWTPNYFTATEVDVEYALPAGLSLLDIGNAFVIRQIF